MDHEYPEHQRQCDHDDGVMCTHHFFDKTLHEHLDRQRLHALIDGKQHWVFAVTPECNELFMKLTELCQERCGAEGASTLITLLPMLPILICFPRDKLALEELNDLVDFNRGSREYYEDRVFITITSEDADQLHQIVTHWINLDHLAN
jgi:hypothetical protein